MVMGTGGKRATWNEEQRKMKVGTLKWKRTRERERREETKMRRVEMEKGKQ